ncbi:MAG: TGS domain-containing protein [Deltaproteobacteria bacterium]|nr:TGS domain-containing protein [Deltaproteobacteria bacterium]
MPANLPPDYFEAEQRFREAKTPEAKIEALEEMLAIMPKHKGTDKLKAMLRERISKLREEAGRRKGGAKARSAYYIEKEGAAQVILAGPPNSGKSSLVGLITKAVPEVAPFPHTTHRVTPGMAHYENIQFQVIDTPPITTEYADPELLDMMRRTDIIVILLDLAADTLQQLEDTLGILHGARIFSPFCDIPEGLKRKPIIRKMLVTVNKMDSRKLEEDFEIFRELSGTRIPCLGISVSGGRNITAFLERLYEMAEIVRVYTKRPGREADRTAPFVVPVGSTLEELAGRIHKDFVGRLKYARIWGRTVRDGQMVQRDYVLQDGDVAELCL